MPDISIKLDNIRMKGEGMSFPSNRYRVQPGRSCPGMEIFARRSQPNR